MGENKKTFYAITYNKNYRKNAKMSQSDYCDIIMILRNNCELHAYTFEIGSVQNRLHMHALISMDEEDLMIVQQGDLFARKGFCFKMIECYNREGWLQYMIKEKSFFTG